MNKHTPGEWRVRNNSIGGPFVSTDSGTVADVRTCGGIHVGGPQHPETIANARLIAAAPDLLESLQQYGIGFTDEAAARAEFGNYQVDRELKRRAAIAKATGEKS